MVQPKVSFLSSANIEYLEIEVIIKFLFLLVGFNPHGRSPLITLIFKKKKS